MDCRQIKEELVFLFVDNEMGRDLLVAYRRHVKLCPHCAREARYTQHFLTLVRRPTVRRTAPRGLRTRILAALPHRRDPIR